MSLSIPAVYTLSAASEKETARTYDESVTSDGAYFAGRTGEERNEIRDDSMK